jgi:hypothetical protein
MRANLIGRQGRVLNLWLNHADRGLRRCNLALEALQPRQPGRIALLETQEESRGKTVLNETRWRLVRWRIRRTNNDGVVHWQAEPLPLRGASRMASGKFGFHDTQGEVRAVIREAAALIEWRSRVVQAGRNSVNAMDAHNRSGIPFAQRHIEAAVAAADAGTRKREGIRAAATQLSRAKAAESGTES